MNFIFVSTSFLEKWKSLYPSWYISVVRGRKISEMILGTFRFVDYAPIFFGFDQKLGNKHELLAIKSLGGYDCSIFITGNILCLSKLEEI